jgi:hypothetical protein
MYELTTDGNVEKFGTLQEMQEAVLNNFNESGALPDRIEKVSLDGETLQEFGCEWFVKLVEI